MCIEEKEAKDVLTVSAGLDQNARIYRISRKNAPSKTNVENFLSGLPSIP